MRILLTGASGFVGRSMVPYLLDRGHSVTALIRPVTPPGAVRHLLASGAEPIRDTAAALRTADAVVHLAAATRARTADAFHQANVEGTRALLAAAASLDTPPAIVLCSSLAAAGPSALGRPRTEADPPGPVSDYGRSKLGAETVVRDFADRVPAVIVRPPVVYGPGDPAFLPALTAMVRAGVGVRPAGDAAYCLIHVADLCAALTLALTNGRRVSRHDPAAGVYHVCDGTPRSWPVICRHLAHALDRRAPMLVPLPKTVMHAVAAGCEAAVRPWGGQALLNRDKARELSRPYWTCCPERARAELGFAPHHLSLDRAFRAALGASPIGEHQRLT